MVCPLGESTVLAGDMIINLSIGGTGWTTDGIFLAIGVGTLLVSPQFESVIHKP